MSIEQHAEALVKYLKDNSIPEGLTESELHTAAIGIIAKHMRAAIDEATAPLRARIAELERSLRQQNYEVCQTLGRALRYPWFKGDQVNFPGASRLDGVCTADHTPETLAVEAAKRIEKLEGLGPLIEEYADACEAYGRSRSSQWVRTREEKEIIGRSVGDTLAKINAILGVADDAGAD